MVMDVFVSLSLVSEGALARDAMKDVAFERVIDNRRLILAWSASLQSICRRKQLMVFCKKICQKQPEQMAMAFASGILAGNFANTKLTVIQFLSEACKSTKVVGGSTFQYHCAKCLPDSIIAVLKMHKTNLTLYIVKLGQLLLYCFQILCSHPENLWEKRLMVVDFLRILKGWVFLEKQSSFHAHYLMCLDDLLTQVVDLVGSSFVTAQKALVSYLQPSICGLSFEQWDMKLLNSEMDMLCNDILVFKNLDNEESEWEDLAAGIHVRRLSLIFCKLDNATRKELMESKDSLIIKTLVLQLSRKNGSCSRIAGQLLSLCIDLVTTTDEKSVATYEMFLDMLNCRDSISNAVYSILARGIDKFESELLPLALGRLATTNIVHQTNVLSVLLEYVSTSNLEGKLFNQDIADRLIQLESNFHDVRQLAGRVVSYLPSDLLLTSLCHKICVPDSVYVRGSAAACLGQVLYQHKHPEQLVKEFLGKVGESESPDLLMDASKQWQFQPHAMPIVWRTLAEQMFMNPSAPGPIGIIRRLVDAKVGLVCLEKVIHDVVLPELDGQHRMLDLDPNVLISRLSPMLFLRMMPLLEGEQLVDVVLDRILATVEFNEIRTQASEVLARMPVHVWPTCLWMLDRYPDSTRVLQAVLFVSCQSMTSRTSTSIPVALLNSLCAVTRMAEHSSVLQGFTQLLFILVANVPNHWCDPPPSRPMIQECNQEWTSDVLVHGPPALPFVLRIVAHETISLKICAASALAMSLSSVCEYLGVFSSSVNSSMENAPRGLISQEILDVAINSYGSGNIHLDSSLLQLMFQVTLTHVKLAQSYPGHTELFGAFCMKRLCALVLTSIESNHEQLRILSIRVVGVLVVMPEEWNLLPNGSLGAFILKLKGISNLDTNQQARSLAEKLLSSLFN